MILSFPSTPIRSFTFPSSSQTNSFLLIWTSFFHYISHPRTRQPFFFFMGFNLFLFSSSYPTLPYPILSYPTPPCPNVPCTTLPYSTLPNLILPYPTLLYSTLPYLILPYIALPYPTLPYSTLPYLILPYVALSYLILPYVALPYSTFPIYIHSICRKTKELPLCPCARSPLYRRAT